ncbi:hypothetical protein SAMN04487968_10561 [Nocardioides terrae]|uniref:Uncharacterized protein n=1 Tax=Nocardioides terrae TaxID=574651 RepID=A0A1I1HYL0_9ACTN|nr:hypothetical protein [Nocardioides terrae]SFC28976.1 hypothetical protein SAMN04487968_10561 [Nocardioides terrae]
MSQQIPSAPHAPEQPASPYDGPTWAPMTSSEFAAQVAPAAPRRRVRDRMGAFRGRVVRLWLALAVGAACLVVGLGLGVLVGRQVSGSGPADLRQPPGMGTGRLPRQDGGPGGFDGSDPGTQSGGQSGTPSDGQSSSGTSS